LKRVRSDRWCDRVKVRLLAGQHPGMYEDRADHLAHTFGARACRVQWTKPGRVTLVFQRRDPLAEVVPDLPIPKDPDLRDLPVGRLEDGTSWTVPLAGSHVLVGGSTGAGKGSLIWSLIRAAAPCVHDGTVQLWCVDPKGGMELSAGEAMFTRFAYDDPADMADLLDDAVALLRERATRLRGVTRKHTPSGIEPRRRDSDRRPNLSTRGHESASVLQTVAPRAVNPNSSVISTSARTSRAFQPNPSSRCRVEAVAHTGTSSVSGCFRSRPTGRSRSMWPSLVRTSMSRGSSSTVSWCSRRPSEHRSSGADGQHARPADGQHARPAGAWMPRTRRSSDEGATTPVAAESYRISVVAQLWPDARFGCSQPQDLAAGTPSVTWAGPARAGDGDRTRVVSLGS
jgi:FtsK/SpoIIIE family